ncbi:MAG: UDP-N-acetylmuramoyl-L-alanine--D-glutamate ligase [Trueperaceae bacterium]
MNPVAPLLVYGLGRSGGAVVARARRHGTPVLFYEQRAEGPDVAAALAAGAERVADVAEALARDPTPRTCVAAPGVPIDHPDLARLRAAGIETIGEVVWVLRGTPARCIGVTGTAGKGTVTRWITDGLLAAGIDAVAGGNIVPALAAVARPEATLVIELSSFQLERAPGLRPDVAVVLNLGVDHLDRHGTVAAYHAAKRALLRELGPQQTLVGNADDPLVAAWLDDSPARVRRFSLAARGDAFLERSSGLLWLDGAPLMGVDELRIVGEHQVANALATALALDAAGASREAIARALGAFAGLPGRYAEVGRLGGVRFIEDSIATRPLAVEAALRSTPAPLVWIAGGVDKGADVDALGPLLRERVALTLAVGASGQAYAAAAARYAPAEVIAETNGQTALLAAVRRGWRELRDHHDGRGAVLLAPLAASFDQFRDYVERAAAFRAAVAELARDAVADEGVTWTPSS